MRRILAIVVVGLGAVVAVGTGVALSAPPGSGQPGEYRPVRGPSAPAEHRFLQKTYRGEGLPRHAYDAVRTLAGAIVGIGVAVLLNADETPADFLEQFDAHLAQFEAGLDLSGPPAASR